VLTWLVKVSYIAIYASWGHLSGSLEKACNQTKKILVEKTKGKRSHRIYLADSKKSSDELGYLHIKVVS